MRKLYIAVLAAAALSLAGSGASAEMKKVRIGTEGAYPPFNFIDSSGELQGFDIDVAKALCDAAEFDCEFVVQDWDGIIPGLLAKKYDAIIASMSITDERMEVVDFTNKYYNTPATFIAAKDSGITDTSPDGLKGKTLGAQSATTHSTYLEDKYTGATVKLYGTQDEANADLKAGRLDGVLADKIVLLEWLENTDDGKCCEFVGDEVRDEQYFGVGVGIAIRKSDPELTAMFNEAIAAILENGKYKEVNDAHFPFSVY